METPVAASASCAERVSWSMSPKAVMDRGPRMPAVRRAAATHSATRWTLTPLGMWQFSKSHHTDTRTVRL
jgi:hypothetical protein